MIKKYEEFILENYNNIESIRDFFKECCSGTGSEFPKGYKILDDNSIFIDGYIEILSNISKIPYKINKVFGDFIIKSKNLTTLENCPESVSGVFKCDDSRIISLEFGPKYVGSSYSCKNNSLKNLIGAPEKINGQFIASHNRLTSLKGSPKRIRSIMNSRNLRLIEGIFDCTTYNGALKTLEDGPSYIEGTYRFRQTEKLGIDISHYPLCVCDKLEIVRNTSNSLLENSLYNHICAIIKENKEFFIPLTDNKIKFHQQLLSLDNSLIKYYESCGWFPTIKKSSKLLY